MRMAFQQLMEDGRNIRDIDKVSHKEVADMAAVYESTVRRSRDSIIVELLGETAKPTPPTIPPKSKGTSGDEAEKLKKGLSSP